jgi:hypothetical protein
MAVLAGILIQQVISKGVDIAGSALSAAAKDKVSTLSGESASATYFVVDEKANLVADTSAGCAVLFTAGSGGGSGPEWLSKVTAEMAQVKAAPDFYMEIGLEHIEANDGGACQGGCRLGQAAKGWVSMLLRCAVTTESRSGLSVTTSM